MFVGLFVTRNCNLDCSYCFIKKNSKDPPLNDLKERIDKIKEIGCNMVYFMGGEPTLRKDIVELTRYCNKQNMFVVMDTNGTLLSKELIDKLADAGMNSMVVSLDGINRARQSKKTLSDNPCLIEDLEYASMKKGLFIAVNIVLTGLNTREVIPLLERITGKGIIITTCLVTQPPSKFISYSKNTVFNKKQLKELDLLFDTLIKKKKEGYPIFEPIHCYEHMKEFIRGRYNWRCGAGRHFFSVGLGGEISLCPETKSLGVNIKGIDKNYYQTYKGMFEKRLVECNKSCVENYALCESYYSSHKLRFFLSS